MLGGPEKLQSAPAAGTWVPFCEGEEFYYDEEETELLAGN